MKSQTLPLYTHLANFVRGTSDEKNWTIAEKSGGILEEEIIANTIIIGGDDKKNQFGFPLAGDVIAWLNFRLDSRPKYYHYTAPSRNFKKATTNYYSNNNLVN